MNLPRLAVALLCSVLLASGCTEQKKDDPPPPPEKKDEGLDPKYKKDPDMRAEGSEKHVAVREDTHPHKRIIFFNNFGQKHTDLIVEELKKNPHFAEFLPGGGKPNRIVIECKYTGDNLRVEVSAAVQAVGIRHHFEEATISKHLEVHRSKD